MTAAAESLDAPEAGRRRTLVYVGDGLLPWGTNVSTLDRDHADLRETFDKAGCQFSAVHVGRAAEAFERLEDLAGPTGGRVFPVLNSANASSELFAWAQNGCPTKTRIESVTVDGVEPADLIVPTAWRRGEPLTVLGRFASRKELRLRLRAGSDAADTPDLQLVVYGEYSSTIWLVIPSRCAAFRG